MPWLPSRFERSWLDSRSNALRDAPACSPTPALPSSGRSPTTIPRTGSGDVQQRPRPAEEDLVRTHAWGGRTPADDTKARSWIVATAKARLARYGPEGMVLGAIACELNVTRHTVYRYFTGTEALEGSRHDLFAMTCVVIYLVRPSWSGSRPCRAASTPRTASPGQRTDHHVRAPAKIQPSVMSGSSSWPVGRWRTTRGCRA
ncbi:TetR/AcrR family transcriptional regulator [Actinomadura nitritigenes]|uniref:TetR/AcrR family transcriptional regulator n=1 Tax=Actinomadura nitritigenes TaxID=134602 RepID=UPI003D9450FC